MSHGPGIIERRIAELFGAMSGEVISRPLSVAEITDHAFALKGRRATRAQRLSTTRAAHRLIRRTKETYDLSWKLPEEEGEKLREKVEKWGGYRIRIIPADKRGYVRAENEASRLAPRPWPPLRALGGHQAGHVAVQPHVEQFGI